MVNKDFYSKSNPLFSDEELTHLKNYLLKNKPDFFSKKEYSLTAPIPIKYNLIKDLSIQDALHYYVISNEEKDIVGEGGFAKIRKVIAKIIIDLKTEVLSVVNKEKVVRIEKTKKRHLLELKFFQEKKAEEKKKESSKETENQTIKEAKTQDLKTEEKQKTSAYLFSHLGTKTPVERNAKIQLANSATFSFWKKFYTVMNYLPGKDLDDVITEEIPKGQYSTKTLLTNLLIPLLETYKQQIANLHYIHRDIKGGNIRAVLDAKNPGIFNFVDFDDALPEGAFDTTFGTPGFLAPETMENSSLRPARPARDIFSLGVLLTACINPYLDPQAYFTDVLKIKNQAEVSAAAMNRIKKDGCYDIDKMLLLDGILRQKNGNDIEPYSFFCYINDPDSLDLEEEQQQIVALLKQMTAKAPENRPSLEDSIKTLEDIAATVEEKHQAYKSQHLHI